MKIEDIIKLLAQQGEGEKIEFKARSAGISRDCMCHGQYLGGLYNCR